MKNLLQIVEGITINLEHITSISENSTDSTHIKLIDDFVIIDLSYKEVIKKINNHFK